MHRSNPDLVYIKSNKKALESFKEDFNKMKILSNLEPSKFCLIEPFNKIILFSYLFDVLAHTAFTAKSVQVTPASFGKANNNKT